ISSGAGSWLVSELAHRLAATLSPCNENIFDFYVFLLSGAKAGFTRDSAKAGIDKPGPGTAQAVKSKIIAMIQNEGWWRALFFSPRPQVAPMGGAGDGRAGRASRILQVCHQQTCDRGGGGARSSAGAGLSHMPGRDRDRIYITAGGQGIGRYQGDQRRAGPQGAQIG